MCHYLNLLKHTRFPGRILDASMESPIQLTDEQQAILDLAEKGHNICILGKAGVGKSTIVKEIKRTL